MNIVPIAINTYKEAIRDKVLYIILVFSIFMLGSSIILSNLSLGQNKKVIIDFGLASLSIFGVLLTIFSGTNLLNKEIEKKTIYLLLTKPMSRLEFILGKHLGLSLTLLTIISLMTFFFYGLIILSLQDYNLSYLKVILLSYFEMIILISIAIFFSTFTPPTMSAFYTLGIYIIGHFSKDLVNFGKMSGNNLIIKLTEMIYYIVPDLEKLNFKNIVLYSSNSITQEVIISAILYAILYTFSVLLISILSFELKDF
jgi:ABC-type transport system involved in multi-copper enzyme maturation permease subunit